MRIAFDISRAQGPRTGLCRYVTSVRHHAESSSHEWLTIERPAGMSATHYLLHRLPTEAARLNADVIFAPHAWDFPGRTEIPIVATLHDVWPWTHPASSDAQSWRHRILQPFPRRAASVICVSDFTRGCAQKLWPAYHESWRVIHSAPLEVFSTRPVSSEKIPDGPFFLALGSHDPRKNFSFLTQLAPQLPAPLVVAGDVNPEPVSNVLTLGTLDDNDLAALYQRAAALIFPSVYEGFGFPPLEAAQCGCPVLAADTSSIPEVLGPDHPGLLSLENVESWSDAARSLMHASERQRFVDAGFAAAARYSWPKTLMQIETALEEAAR